MPTNELHVIFGTGALGRAIMNELLRQGKRVRMANRQGKADVPAGVDVVKADALDPATVRAAATGAQVAYNATNAPYDKWPEQFPQIWRGITEGVAGTGARLVIGDNLYMYGKVDGAIREGSAYAAHTRKGKTRIVMANEAMAAHKAGKVQVAIGRASDYFGPYGGAQGAFNDRVVPVMLAGKKVQVVGSLDTPHSYTYIEDFGKGLVVLGAHDAAFGQTWHIPNAPILTTREMLAMFFEAAGLPLNIGTVPNIALQALGLFNPMLREVVEMLYEFNAPFVVDSSKFVQAFGDIATPHYEAVRATLAYYRKADRVAVAAH